MRRRPPRSKRATTLFPYTPLFRSPRHADRRRRAVDAVRLHPAASDRADRLPDVRPGAGPLDLARGRADLRGFRLCREEEMKRSEEHTSELQSLMRISYAVFCLKKKKNTVNHPNTSPEHCSTQ